MNFTARIAAFILMAALSLTASAADNFKDIQKQMQSRNWAQSEQMLKTYISEKPNSAKAHYLLAQVYEQNRKYNLAQKYLAKANAIDPSKRFASSGQADKMAVRLSGKTTTSSSERYEAPAYTAPAYTAPTQKVAQPSQPTNAAAPVQKSSGGSGFGTFLMFILVLAILGGVGHYVITTRTRKQQLAAMDDQRRSLQAQAVQQQNRILDLRKKLSYENQASSDLANDATELAAAINNVASSLRADVTDFNYPLTARRGQVEELERRLAECESRLARKAFMNQRVAPKPTPAPCPTYTPPPAPTVVHQPQVNNDAAAVAAGVVLNNAAHEEAQRQLRLERERNERLQRELEREREEDRRREREDEDRRARQRHQDEMEELERQARRRREREREDREERAAAAAAAVAIPAMDFGGSDRDDDAPLMDFGGSDREDPPPMDFGGDNDDDRRRNNDE